MWLPCVLTLVIWFAGRYICYGNHATGVFCRYRGVYLEYFAHTYHFGRLRSGELCKTRLLTSASLHRGRDARAPPDVGPTFTLP